MHSKEEVEFLLAPYKEALRAVVTEAWKTYQEDCKGVTHKLQQLGRSVIMNNFCIDNAKKEFASFSNVEIRKNGHGIIIDILTEQGYLLSLRFKKLDHKFQTNNAKSVRNERFTNQLYLWKEEIPKPSKLINLNVGYQMDPFWTNIKIFVTYPDGIKSFSWKFRLSENEEIKHIIPAVSVNKPLDEPKKKRVVAIATEKVKSKGNKKGAL